MENLIFAAFEEYEDVPETVPLTERPQGGAPVEVPRVGGEANPLEENVDLLGFHPERAHLLLQGVFGDFPHHNNASHLDRGIADDAAMRL